MAAPRAFTSAREHRSFLPSVHASGACSRPFPGSCLTPKENLSRNRRDSPQTLSRRTHRRLILIKWDFSQRKSIAKSERFSPKSLAWPRPSTYTHQMGLLPKKIYREIGEILAKICRMAPTEM